MLICFNIQYVVHFFIIILSSPVIKELLVQKLYYELFDRKRFFFTEPLLPVQCAVSSGSETFFALYLGAFGEMASFCVNRRKDLQV